MPITIKGQLSITAKSKKSYCWRSKNQVCCVHCDESKNGRFQDTNRLLIAQIIFYMFSANVAILF